MAERYQTIYKQGAMYQDDCPLIILASALLRDTATGRMIVQLKLQNVGRKSVSAVFVDIKCQNAAREDVGHKSFQYLDLHADSQSMFGTQAPIELPDSTTRNYSISILQVVFTDGQIWKNAGHCSMQPLVIDPIASKQYSAELIDQFRRASKIETSKLYYPREVSTLVICVCGAVYCSTAITCPRCGYSLKQLWNMLDKAALQKDYEARLERERAEALQQQTRKKIKAKRYLSIGLLAIVVIFAFVFLLTRFLIPAGHYMKGEKRLATGDFTGAVEAFTKAGDHRDASERIPMVYYAQGEALLIAEDYVGAVAAFTKAAAFQDVSERIAEIYYAQAENFLSEGANGAADTAFRAASEYKDASERIGEGYYHLAEELLALADYDGATAAFEAAGSYLDASDRIAEVYHAKGSSLFAEGDYLGAVAAFNRAGSYTRFPQNSQYQYAVSLYYTADKANIAKASKIFLPLGNYLNSQLYYNNTLCMLTLQIGESASVAFTKTRYASYAGDMDLKAINLQRISEDTVRFSFEFAPHSKAETLMFSACLGNAGNRLFHGARTVRQNETSVVFDVPIAKVLKSTFIWARYFIGTNDLGKYRTDIDITNLPTIVGLLENYGIEMIQIPA